MSVKLPPHVANPGLAALIAGSGFPSLERFAAAVNHRGWDLLGIKTSYDHVTVKRWLAGSVCQYPEVVAAVLSDAWGVDVPVAVIWPELRDGAGPTPAHQQPWVPDRTLGELSILVRSDMLTRRELLAGSITVVTGTPLTDPIARWLNMGTAAMSVAGHDGPGRIDVSTVEAIEQATRHFMAVDAAVGGGVVREAAVGQLKFAVDLATHSGVREEAGNRLLMAIADLAGWVGWMSHDAGMAGPAQRYLLYGLQAAGEAHGDGARMLAVKNLVGLARQMQSLGHPATGLRLIDQAVNQLPSRLNKVRALLWSLRAQTLASMGRQ
ncbi:MAG TPA: hypothetical protein VFE14_04245, partial [Micromonosporaceae bacterium]|nr:hypothetical protein [Micromonosporaceae bacterium]